MSSPASRDLFDDSSMTFGEHLEELRMRLFLALGGFVVCLLVTLYTGERLVGVIRAPIDAALAKYGEQLAIKDDLQLQRADDTAWLPTMFHQFLWQIGLAASPPEAVEQTVTPPTTPDAKEPHPSDEITVQFDAHAIASQLHQAVPESYPAPPESLKEHPISIVMRSPAFRAWQGTTAQMNRPVTLNVQEAFMTYMKVSVIAALILASPWIFYQLWMFVAVGLYKHERKFVYVYGAMSLVLFLTGVVFCFKLVFPYVLNFLLQFNLAMEMTPQIRMSEWVSFAVTLPLMFGISFQLPLVMRFLSALSIFTVEAYRQQRRLAILVIAFLSMVLTPAEPMSMILMMVPLVVLYELGIILCQHAPAQNPFDAEPV